MAGRRGYVYRAGFTLKGLRLCNPSGSVNYSALIWALECGALGGGGRGYLPDVFGFALNLKAPVRVNEAGGHGQNRQL